MISEKCVKCGRPRTFNPALLVDRCPWCKDFFKPDAEKIVLWEEELMRLKQSRPGAVFFRHPLLMPVLCTLSGLLALISGYHAAGAILLVFLVFLHFYIRKHQISKRIQTIEAEVRHLESSYQNRENLREGIKP